MTSDQLNSIFTYHAPHGNQAKRYEALRAGGLQLAQLINTLAPESGEKTLAIRRVQEAVMYANAAIACNEAAPVIPVCHKCSRQILSGQLEGNMAGGDQWICAECYEDHRET